MFDPLNQNGDDEIDFSEKNLFEGLPVDEICKNTVDFPEEEFKKPEKGEEAKEEEKERGYTEEQRLEFRAENAIKEAEIFVNTFIKKKGEYEGA